MKIADPRAVNRRYVQSPVPTVVLLELTHTCNEKCVHCVRDCNGLAPDEDQMTTEDWISVIDEVAALKGLAIGFTGGEAMLQPDFYTLVERVREHKMAVSLKTNGLLLARDAAKLRVAGVRYLEVSLHGATPEIHDRVTRVPGSFARCVEGVKAARAVGHAVTLKCNFFRWSAWQVERVKAIAKELDCVINRDFFLINSDHGRNFDRDFVSPHQIREIERVWPQSTMPANQNKEKAPLRCTQGINGAAVTADGEVLSCVLVRKSLGLLADEKFTAIWKRHAGHSHELDYSRFERCSNCALLPKCRVCIGQNHSASGSFYESPIERCYVTMSLYGKEMLENRYSSEKIAT